ncbi:MAG: mechanosensitive ion channel family protein [Candidatus Promineifilaceae bacterium]
MDISFLTTGLYVLSILAGAYILLRFLPQAVDKIIDRIPVIDKTLGYFISDSSGLVILIILIVSGIFQLDANARLVATLITVGSGAFIFTTEGWVHDAFSGIGLQIYNQFRVGDWVTVAGVRGHIVRLGLFRTDLETLELDLVSVRNTQVFGSNIINHSGIPFREISVIVHTADYGEYGDDIRGYLAAVETIARRVEKSVCPEAAVEAGLHAKAYFLEFGSSSDYITVVYYSYDRDEAYRDAVSAMHVAMAEELRPKGVILGQVNANTIDNVMTYRRVE